MARTPTEAQEKWVQDGWRIIKSFDNGDLMLEDPEVAFTSFYDLIIVEPDGTKIEDSVVHQCKYCGAHKDNILGLCSACGRFPNLERLNRK